MKTKLMILVGAVALALSVETQAFSLATPFNANNAQDGAMFDVVTFGNNLTATGIDLNFRGTGNASVTVQVYSKAGTFVGFQSNPAAWTLVDSLPGVISGDEGTPVFVDIADFALAANAVTGLYITLLNTDARNLAYTNGTGIGTVIAANTDLQILEGAGKAYPFGSTFNNRRWNGVIHYDIANNVPEPTTLVLCGIGLAGFAFSRVGRKPMRSDSIDYE